MQQYKIAPAMADTVAQLNGLITVLPCHSVLEEQTTMSTILVIAAHPDDETMLAGGTLAMYTEQGHSVYILSTTRGEGGEIGEPPICTRAELGAVREGELRCAAAALGARAVFFLPYIDPYMEIGGAAASIDAPLHEFAAAIGEYLRQLRPEIILTHGSNGEYGHPQHIHTHRATRLALAGSGLPAALWSWAAWYDAPEREQLLNRYDRADVVRDISPWLDAKVAAADCHQTQHTMFLRNSKVASVRETVMKIESFHRWS
jgi:LmbE family N-acetylglucosaminyl deacetylase